MPNIRKARKTFYAARQKSYFLHRSEKNRRPPSRKRSMLRPNRLSKGHERFKNEILHQEKSNTKLVYKNEDNIKTNHDMTSDNYDLFCKLYTLMVVKRDKGNSLMVTLQQA